MYVSMYVVCNKMLFFPPNKHDSQFLAIEMHQKKNRKKIHRPSKIHLAYQIDKIRVIGSLQTMMSVVLPIFHMANQIIDIWLTLISITALLIC